MASYKEIERDTIISPLFLKSKPVKISEKDLKNIYDFILSDLLSNISSTARNGASTLLIFESIYQFIKWKQKKLLLNISPYQRKTHVYENGVYWASLGVNVGSELNKNRPVLIWKKRCNGKEEKDFSYIVIPITSKSKSRNYYMNVPIVINSRQCYLRIEDMRRINIRRISRPILDEQKNIIFIDEEKRKEIMDSLERFYIFENRHKKI